MPIADWTARRVDDAASVTKGIVVHRGVVRRQIREQDRPVPLAHRRAVARSASEARAQLQPIVGWRRGTCRRGGSLYRKRNGGGIRFRLGRAAFEHARQPPELEVILQQSIVKIRVQRSDLPLEVGVLRRLPRSKVVEPLFLLL